MNKVTSILLLFIIFSCQRNNCDVKVKLESGEIIKCRYIQSYVSGVSNLKLCNGEDFQTNTSNILEVTE
jgi:hypothetical protein